MGGLNDRLSALRGAGNLAASLCARLVVPQPCQMLDPRHNKGMRVDCSIGWERYMHATMLKDDSQMMVPIRNARTNSRLQIRVKAKCGPKNWTCAGNVAIKGYTHALKGR